MQFVITLAVALAARRQVAVIRVERAAARLARRDCLGDVGGTKGVDTGALPLDVARTAAALAADHGEAARHAAEAR